GDGRVAPDGRHLAVVDVAELLRATAARQPAHLAPDEVALLEGDGGHVEVGPALVIGGRRQVADDEDVVVPGRTQVAPDDDAPSGTDLEPGGRRERCRLDACSP